MTAYQNQILQPSIKETIGTFHTKFHQNWQTFRKRTVTLNVFAAKFEGKGMPSNMGVIYSTFNCHGISFALMVLNL